MAIAKQKKITATAEQTETVTEQTKTAAVAAEQKEIIATAKQTEMMTEQTKTATTASEQKKLAAIAAFGGVAVASAVSAASRGACVCVWCL